MGNQSCKPCCNTEPQLEITSDLPMPSNLHPSRPAIEREHPISSRRKEASIKLKSESSLKVSNKLKSSICK